MRFKTSPANPRQSCLALLLLALLPLGAAPKPAFPENPPPSGAAFYEAGNPVLALTRPEGLGLEAFGRRVEAAGGREGALGLVLSGGSARAFAHIGVLKALEEEGIRPDFLVADSMGAIVALLYAAGLSPDAILALLDAVPAASLFDPVLPTEGGFLEAGRFEALVRAVLGEADLGELPIPVLVVCEDLLSRRQVLLAAGELATVMRAAFALPAIFEPVALGPWLLIDGGITAVVPAAAAAAYADDLIAATSLYDPELDYANPFVVLNRSIDIVKTRNSLEELELHKPLVIRCAVEDLSYMEFSDPRLIAERGYRSARAVMGEVLALAEPRPAEPGLEALRARLAAKVEEVVEARARGERFPVRPDLRWKPSGRLLDEAAGGWEVFRGRRYLGLEAELMAGRVELGLGLFSGLEGEPDRALSLGLSGDWVPLGSLRLGFASLLSGPYPGEALWKEEPELALAAWAEAPFGPWGGLVAGPYLEAEGSRGGPAAGSWRLGAGLLLRGETGGEARLSLEGGWLLDSRGAQGPAWEASLALRPLPGAELRLGSGGRLDLGEAGFSPEGRDGYRGPLPELSAELLGFGSLEVAWLARFLETDIGELLMLEEPELALFLDALAGRGSASNPLFGAAGLSAACSVSFLGLAPVELSFAAALDLGGEGFQVSLRSGRRIP